MSACPVCYKEHRSAGLHPLPPESGSKLCKEHKEIQDKRVIPEHDSCECGESVFCRQPFMTVEEMEKADKLMEAEGLRALQKRLWEET